MAKRKRDEVKMQNEAGAKATVSRSAFDKVWSDKGWSEVTDDAPTPTATGTTTTATTTTPDPKSAPTKKEA